MLANLLGTGDTTITKKTKIISINKAVWEVKHYWLKKKINYFLKVLGVQNYREDKIEFPYILHPTSPLFLAIRTACGILVLWPRIEPTPSEWKHIPNYWTTREVPNFPYYWHLSMIHLLQLLNQFWSLLLLTKVHTLWIFPQFLSNVLFLFQDPVI